MTVSDGITPEIFVHEGPAAIEFYKRAFGALERSRMMSQDGKKLVNGQIEIRGHRLFVCDEFSAGEGGTCRCPHTLGGPAGATVMIPVADMFWVLARAVILRSNSRQRARSV